MKLGGGTVCTKAGKGLSHWEQRKGRVGCGLVRVGGGASEAKSFEAL